MTDSPKEPVWHREVITPEVERTLRDLEQRSLLKDFYLAGGTGLALHLGHRRSVDLDFFTASPFDEEHLIQKLLSSERFSVASKSPQTLHASIGAVKISFLTYAYRLLFPLSSFVGVKVADPRDIACMKLNAIASRGTRRDFIDLYCVAKEQGLARLLELFRAKYAEANYNLVHILKSLAYFREAEQDPMPDMLAPISWDEVKRFFSTEAPPLA